MTEQELKEAMDKQWHDLMWPIQTHFIALGERIEKLENQIKTQNRVIKEAWGKIKGLETR